ncbi:MAG TPA: uracil-DNA glycosylase [Holophagaceae bacterium]|nr:uracil-DNA glycosylase [Holophagaceae bacterium]
MMATPLEAWRDTLKDLGVMGLVRPEMAEPVPQQALPAPLPSPAPPKAVAGGRKPEAGYAPPTDPIGCPPQAAVAGSSSLADLEAAIKGCLACALGPGRLNFVFGEGDPRAGLMFIGEGPGRDEDLQGRPFVGKAGELLDKMISAIGLSRREVYIANVVKCRPPDNRTPFPEEAAACLGYLRRQIELIQPKVIVTLGATPLRELVGLKEGITKVRGQWKRIEAGGRDIPVMPTFHPAYVLRQYTQDVRRAVWADLKAAKEELEKAVRA